MLERWLEGGEGSPALNPFIRGVPLLFLLSITTCSETQRSRRIVCIRRLVAQIRWEIS